MRHMPILSQNWRGSLQKLLYGMDTLIQFHMEIQKSGLVAMVYLLGEIGESGEKPEQTILFLGTCDEEKSGLGAEKILEEIDLSSGSLLLIGEPTGCKLGVAQKGCIWGI